MLPLVCSVAPILTLLPVVVNVALREVRFVPDGTLTDMVWLLSLIVPVLEPIENEVNFLSV